MEDKVALHFSKKPSDFLTLWQAYRSRKSRFTPGGTIPEIHVKRNDFLIDNTHLEKFNEICGVSPTTHLHILYPFTIVYPYLMRILCRKEMPFSQFKTLNTRNSVIMHREIKPDDRFRIDCYNSAARVIPNGIEFDFKAELYSNSEKVWEITATYFNRGKFGDSDPLSRQPRLESPDNPAVISEWFLEAKDRFRFGKISGDTNGIHYGYHYARMFGFKRDFAQPIRIITRCVSDLPGEISDRPAQLDFFLKGPVYYESMLTLKNSRTGTIDRFDLYCEGNDRPCICGRMVQK